MAAPIVQSATNFDSNSSASSVSATFSGAATAGNLIVMIGTSHFDSTRVLQAGYSDVITNGGVPALHVAAKVSTGGETVVTFEIAGTRKLAVVALEISGLLTSAPWDVTVNAVSSGAVTSQTSGTTGTTNQAVELAIAAFGVQQGNKAQTGRTYTEGFVEEVYIDPGGLGAPGIAVALKNLTSTGTVESTFATTDTGDEMHGMMATFKEIIAGGPITGRHYPRGVMRGEMRGVA